MPKTGWHPHSREVRVAACADYLLEKPTKIIFADRGMNMSSIRRYLLRTGHFKLRKQRGVNRGRVV